MHQPKRLRTLRFFDIGANGGYFDDDLNRQIIKRVAQKCYLPANALFLKLIKENPMLKVAFSISGITIDQLEAYAPEVLDSFRQLAETGSVEFLTETYYHSLACMMPGNEFELQVEKHQKKILHHFGTASTVFRNTELIYSEDIAKRVHALGFKGLFIDGIDRLLANQSPNHLYEDAVVNDLKLLLRNYRLSDDISFRFTHFPKPLTAGRYINWLRELPADDKHINLAMDYETFGEHHKKETGIFDFLESLLEDLARDDNFRFITPSEAVASLAAAGRLAVPGYISWADKERDLSAWLGNDMQRDAFDSLTRLEADVKSLLDRSILRDWRSLQTSDHFYYMATKNGSDGDVHTYFSPYLSPYEAFINYMNVLADFSLRIKARRASIGLGEKTEKGGMPVEHQSAVSSGGMPWPYREDPASTAAMYAKFEDGVQ